MDDDKRELEMIAFNDRRPQYLRFTECVNNILAEILRVSGIDLFSLEKRTKTSDGFREKIGRVDKNYSDPINEITDICGVRVIAYQTSDVSRISQLIEENFSVDQDNSIDKNSIIDDDRFGYLSVHYVVSLTDVRMSLIENSNFGGFKAEIQVRTVLQHAWAAIDHKLRYKTKEETPRSLRRRLFRISALLETADAEFESLRDEMHLLRVEYKKDVEEGNLSIAIDADSLYAYAYNSDIAKEIADNARDNLIEITPPPPNRVKPEFANLLLLTEMCKITSIEDLDLSIKKEMPRNKYLLGVLNSKWRASMEQTSLQLVVTRDALLRISLLFTLPIDAAREAIPALKFGPKLRLATQDTYNSEILNGES